MKIRNGFVSNSSSSSFIVLFPHKPKSKEDLKEMMFEYYADKEALDYYSVSMTVEQVVDRVWEDIAKGKNKVDLKNIGGHIYEVDEGGLSKLARDIWDEDYNVECRIYHALRDKYGDQNKKWFKDELYKKYVKAQKVARQSEKNWIKQRLIDVKEWHDDFKAKYKYHKYEQFFVYSDENGEGLLEHGDIFRNLPHLTISNH